MRITRFIVLIVFIGLFNRDYFANIDDLFIYEDGEGICVFESVSDDVNDEQSFVIGMFLGTGEKSNCPRQTNQKTIERCLYVETPPPEN
mgnify:CR=1 FL=1